MDIEAQPVPLVLHTVQPTACHVLHFKQHLQGNAPDFPEIEFHADAAVIPSPNDRKLLSVALLIEGFRRITETTGKQFFSISTTTDFALLDGERTRADFPLLLDIDLPPFNTAVSLAIGLTRGHLLTRFQGSAWPSFILPSFNAQEFSQALKKRRTPAAGSTSQDLSSSEDKQEADDAPKEPGNE